MTNATETVENTGVDETRKTRTVIDVIDRMMKGNVIRNETVVAVNPCRVMKKAIERNAKDIIITIPVTVKRTSVVVVIVTENTRNLKSTRMIKRRGRTRNVDMIMTMLVAVQIDPNVKESQRVHHPTSLSLYRWEKS